MNGPSPIPPTRRRFLKTTAAVLGALAVPACGRVADEPAAGPPTAAPITPLRILILGGTGFIGPHMVRYARSRGHTVTLFNRGRTDPTLFPDVETLTGDRDGNLTALEGHAWDAVVDNSGYVPRIVGDSARLLKNAAHHYLFISTLSVYASFDTPNMDENHPRGTLDDPTVEEIDEETYGPLKALCEDEVHAAFPDGAIIVRPGYIVGPGDRSDRWTYWPVRVDHGGEMLAPGHAADPIQIIDARDLSAWAVRLVESQATGTFNAVGPASPLTMGEMLETAKTALESDVTLTWVDSAFLRANEISVPIWESPDGEFSAIHRVNGGRAWSNGLSLRPLADTITDTVAWWRSLDDERRSQMRAGLRVPPDLPAGPASMEAVLEQEARLLRARET